MGFGLGGFTSLRAGGTEAGRALSAATACLRAAWSSGGMILPSVFVSVAYCIAIVMPGSEAIARAR